MESELKILNTFSSATRNCATVAQRMTQTPRNNQILFIRSWARANGRPLICSVFSVSSSVSSVSSSVSSLVAFSSAAFPSLLSAHPTMLAAVAYRPLPRRLVATAVLRRHLSYSRALFVSPSPDANQTTVTATSPLPSENPPPSPPDTLLTFPLNPSKDSILQNTFYQRKLPSELVHFSSREGKALFREAMDLGHAEGFFNLTGNFTMQSEPAYCGPSSCE